MPFRDIPIRRKLIIGMLVTNGVVILLTCLVYFAYEVLTFRQSATSHLSTLGKIVSLNSTAALAFDSPDDANEILSALKAEQHIVAAGLYDINGKLFSKYPADLSADAFPEVPKLEGFHFEQSHLIGFQKVIQGDKILGILYLKSDMGAMYERLEIYGIIVLIIVSVSFLLAYVLSQKLQQLISRPILILAAIAKTVSIHKDYSVRAAKLGEDELGSLTDSFNHMLTQIQHQSIVLLENRERFENIVQSMGDAYVSLNNQWQYTYVNQKALVLMGKTNDELFGKTIWSIFPDIVGTVFEKEYRKVMAERTPATLETFDSAYDMWLEVRAYPHEDGIAIFYTNITKYKKAEEDIRSFNQKLEQKVEERTAELGFANKELEAFSYSVSHDLRAPLRSIHGYMNIFNEDYSHKFDDEARRLMNIIMTNAKRMGLLIDDLLTFSQLGRRELTKAKVPMQNMVEGIWEDLIKLEAKRHIKLTLNSLPMANVDHVTIKQVWVNLISNAIKYSRHKENAVIEVGYEELEDMLIFCIKDNGAGFDMTYYDKLFGVFQRLHAQHEFEGTGVGLAIVQRIVAKHGGKVWANAKPNEGATFFFSLPK